MNDRLETDGFHFVQKNLEKAGYTFEGPLDLEALKVLLRRRFEIVDFFEATEEVRDFLNSPNDLNQWNLDLFLSSLDSLRA